MPDNKPTKTEERRPNPQPQQGQTPPAGQVVRADATALDHLKQPDSKQGDEPQPAQKARESQSLQKPPRQYRHTLEVANIAFTIIFSAAIVWFTWTSTDNSTKQGKIMEDQSKLMLQSLQDAIVTRETDNRAWVWVKEAEMQVFEVGKPIQMGVLIANSGDSPALNVVFTRRPELLSRPLAFITPMSPEAIPPPPNKTTGDAYPVVQPSSTLGPGQEMRVMAQLRILDVEWESNIKNEKAFVHYLGMVEYDDIFGKRHFTVFCALFDGRNKALAACGGGTDDKR
jgi:hypothetical protein